MKWIDINERRPEFDVPVLVCEKDQQESISVARIESLTQRKDSLIYSFKEGYYGYGDCYITVTHWMPLPELPQ